MKLLVRVVGILAALQSSAAHSVEASTEPSGPQGPVFQIAPPPTPGPFGATVPPVAVDPYDWHLLEVLNNVALYKKEVPGATIPAYRAVGELKVGIGKLVRISFDSDYYTRWMAKVKVAQTVRRISEREAVVHLVMGAPWPVKDRDLVVKLKLEVDAPKRQVTLFFESTEDPAAPEPGTRVRALMYPSRLILTEIEPGRTRVETEAHGDPKGAIPKWLVNLYQKNIPRVSLKRIHTAAMQPDIPAYPLWEGRSVSR